jgi:transcriptional regulator with XRE-family HTH domain
MTPPAGPHSSRVAANVAAELARRDLDWTDLAERLGIHPSKARRWKRRVQPIDLDELHQIAAVLDVPIATLLD